MKFTETQKRQLFIYVMIAYGVTFVMGLIMWYGYGKGVDVTVFPTAQMLYPAAGVILAYMGTKREGIPKGFFYSYLAVTAVTVVCAVLSVLINSSVWVMAANMILVAGSVLCWILLLAGDAGRREISGLKGRNWKASAFCIMLFVVLYFLRVAVLCAIGGNIGEFGKIFTNNMFWVSLFGICINFFLVFIAFFGEEYGWRYFLQPLLQQRFGKRAGVIVLGIVWGLWHLPVDFFYYAATTDYGVILAVGQQITCITLGIFFAYAYMKTKNIWVPVILHFLNNNLVPLISGNYDASVLQNQTGTWTDVLVSLVVNGVIFGIFLFAKEFRREE